MSETFHASTSRNGWVKIQQQIQNKLNKSDDESIYKREKDEERIQYFLKRKYEMAS